MLTADYSQLMHWQYFSVILLSATCSFIGCRPDRLKYKYFVSIESSKGIFNHVETTNTSRVVRIYILSITGVEEIARYPTCILVI